LIAKTGLDGHDRGAKVVARALCDAGADVLYTGIRQRVEHIVMTAAKEEVDVLGLSFLSGDHMTLVPMVIQQLKAAGLADLPVIVGGIILKHHIPELEKFGVKKVFLPGTPLNEIVAFVKEM